MTLATTTGQPPATDLAARLRRRTASAHASLEAALDLLRAPSQARMADLLERFLAFHLAWEQALDQWPRVEAFMAARSRIEALRRDLVLLGRTLEQVAAVVPAPRCEDLTTSEAAAVGSAYVLEGSTLGGRLVARALAGAAWAPPSGLRYFDPYGKGAGRMWRAFCAWADAMTPEDQHEAAADAAARTFARLQAWLAP